MRECVLCVCVCVCVHARVCCTCICVLYEDVDAHHTCSKFNTRIAQSNNALVKILNVSTFYSCLFTLV